METIIVIGLATIFTYWAFKAGKRDGSRKGFSAGRYKRRR